MPDKPLIVQSDMTLLLDVHSPDAESARNDLIAFAELIKSPEHVHTFAITSISLWNAATVGIGPEEVLERLIRWSRFSIPDNVAFFVKDIAGRFGLVVLREVEEHASSYLLTIESERAEREILARKHIKEMLTRCDRGYLVSIYNRGELKLQLIKLGYPVDDRVPLERGIPVPMNFKQLTGKGNSFFLRDYQKSAADSILGDGGPGSGYGVIVLPCGSGKTVVGMEIMRRLATRTLILTTNVAAVHQWIGELVDKLDLDQSHIGEYSGSKKEICPVTVCTYQVLTWRASKEDDFVHMSMLKEGKWGLIIYDEVHMLPAPVFKITAELQAVHRVGLTATLIREDHREDEVFSLVGPKRFDIPWSQLESQGWIAEAQCVEIRVPLPRALEIPYALGTKREKYRIASENPEKIPIVKQLIENHSGEYILVIGQYLDQLKEIAEEIKAPLITGATGNAKRDELYAAFRAKKERILVVSKVANFAIDLPDASVAIQVSGTFGSRQEEAQRLGRILRPKETESHFYSLVTRYSSEEEFAANRQKFLIEQGYSYHVEVWE
ncbi:MAG: DEAD/DEAH box helicase [Spirochaetales bacterium]|nr:DEAD/DEAH box helicase [Spirochaetales bacterium]